MSYLRDPGRGAERNIQRLAFKYVLINDELYRRTTEDAQREIFGVWLSSMF